ncbi:unnamed protein product [Leuciscus chuanchicus]
MVNHGCLRTLIPWRAQDWYHEGVTMGVVSRRKVFFTDASNLGWGALHEGKPASGLWSSTEQSLHINCLEMKAVCLALKAFLSNLKGHHVLVRTDNMSVVAYINRQGDIRSGNLYAIARDLLLWAQTNLSSLRAAHIPGIQNLGHQAGQGERMPSPPSGPPLGIQAVVSRAVSVIGQNSLACSAEERPPHTGQRDDMASTTRLMGPPCLAPKRVPRDLPEKVLNTISEARAPSTRRLYALKLSGFSSWCLKKLFDPGSCEVSVILYLLQELLDAGRSPSTLKVYVEAIAAHHAPVAGQSLGRNDLVVRFLKGARRMNPSRPPSVPTWDLSTVLGALKSPPFEPLAKGVHAAASAPAPLHDARCTQQPDFLYGAGAGSGRSISELAGGECGFGSDTGKLLETVVSTAFAMSVNERREEDAVQINKATSPKPCLVSMKSFESIGSPPNISDSNSSNALKEEDAVQTNKATSPKSCLVSMKSFESIGSPPNISVEAVTSDPDKQHVKEASLHTDTLLKETKYLQHDSQQTVDYVLQRVKDQHKTSMKKKYESLFEGIKMQENQTLLNRIYTQLYIIDGESEGVNEEHEVLQMEKTARTQDRPIYCNDIFKPLHQPRSEDKDKIQTVLTKGIAGIGKTFSVQKLILDWTEGTANQDVDFIFVLPFRELNLIKDVQYSLHRLLLDFHPELQDLDSKIYEECKVVFIFDGLDESRITLMFTDIQKVCDVNKSSSVGVLMSNLIRGDLLPSAHIWITSRPAAANQIPSKYINRVTEIQGFNEPQKEEYFRKRISDEHQASRIISHIKRSRSLHIMCHIPVFCWISATVLQNLLKQDDSAEIPQTLTEMYIHFLLTQINMRNQKYDERDPEKVLKSNREVIVKLAELAFKQLMKGNVMFYEEDLIESGIDVTDASVYSGICTEIFKEKSVINQRKIYCFIHLSFQEFLAALYLFFCHATKNTKSLKFFLEAWYRFKEISLYELLTSAVDKSLRSENGHLDLFLRFLLGVSLESNQILLQDLLTDTEHSSEIIMRTTQYIQNKIKGDEHLSADRCINLFLCLLELNDQTLYREIQEFLKSKKHSKNKLSLAHCSTIAYMFQISEEGLDELDMKRYNTSEDGRRRLIPAVVNCRKALLTDCNLTGQCSESLSSILQSSNSLRELDLSNNDLQDSGVELLSDGLKSSYCQLEILRLSICNLTGQCCESLSSILQSSNSLRELDLSNNDLQDSGVKLLSDGLKSSYCQLNILRLSGCMVTEEGCCFLASALSSNPSHLRELDLSYNHPGQSLVKLVSDPKYRLDKLKYVQHKQSSCDPCVFVSMSLKTVIIDRFYFI